MKKFSELIKDLNKSPRGKAILFFVGYAFFFIFLMIFVRFLGRGNTDIKQYDEVSKYNFSLSNVVDDNYTFKHEVLVDGNIISYEGSRLDDKELFVKRTATGSYDFYREGIDYFSNNNGLWIRSDNPYDYYEFFEVENIIYLLDKAMLEYKTDYESGKKIYNFKITTTTIHELIDGNILDIADDANEIIVTSDDRGYVSKIEYKLSSYCKVLGICNSDMNITLEYENYGKVEEITSPLD